MPSLAFVADIRPPLGARLKLPYALVSRFASLDGRAP